MTAEDLLVGAAELVERPGGWCQHELVTKEGAACLLGAILVANGDMSLDGQITYRGGMVARSEARRALALEIGEPGWEASYNNAPGRTAAEVAALCRNAKRHLVTP